MAWVARAYIARPVRGADVRQVLLCESAWRIFEGWRANDGVSKEKRWCTIQPRTGLGFHRLGPGPPRGQETAGPYRKGRDLRLNQVRRSTAGLFLAEDSLRSA